MAIQAESTYRKGGLKDLKKIQNLTLLAYGQFKNIITKENWQEWEEKFNNESTYTQLFDVGTCFVCDRKDEIAGVAFIIPKGNPYKWFDANWSYIRLVGVNPKSAGIGIGRKLTELCIEEARKNGENTIALHTSEFQDAARHIYESLGFQKLKEFELFEKKYWIYTISL
jgi:ribosomal protein S18 acetylase RimI-like enzyme